MAAARQAWRKLAPQLDPDKLVFIDETGASTKMARLYGRSKRGQRCRAAVPHGHWLTTTFTAALRRTALTAPMTLDGPMNAAAFRAYVEQVLVPTLDPGDIVVMDNLPAHKVAAVRTVIEACGASLLLLPPIRRISIRSRTLMPNSNRTCARPLPGQSTPSKPRSPTPYEPSRQTNAPTTSTPQDTVQLDQNLL